MWSMSVACVVQGSSPLARGLQNPTADELNNGRIIPARAGFTCDYDPNYTEDRDHPRSRGVYSHASPSAWNAKGSSPLARGLRQLRGSRRGCRRIIPARAGFTPGYVTCRGPTPGSSPLARGLLKPCGVSCDDLGIIPARAGFTPADARERADLLDHPRSRGVYWGIGLFSRRILGSSPLARGLLRAVRHLRRQLRIIPARAGFTQYSLGGCWRVWDHPRSRGVYFLSSTS